MVGRLLRVAATAIAIAVALVTPIIATTTTTPASANTVVDGCTIVSNPTPTNFTNCPNAGLAGANLSGVNLSFANLAGASFVSCSSTPPANCQGTELTSANLTDANLSGIDVYDEVIFSTSDFATAAANFAFANLSGANLTDTSLGGADLQAANLTDADLMGGSLEFQQPLTRVIISATLTGANVTGTILVPPNQDVTATSQAGAAATWSTPAGIPGEDVFSCTPASGATFPLFANTVSCVVGDTTSSATGTFQVYVTPTTEYFTRVLIPSGSVTGSVLVCGSQVLDAGASDAPGVTSVVFEVSGGTLSDQVIATGTLTYYGWLARWSTTSVPNGTYSLQSVATDVDASTDTSAPITVTVNNQPPSTPC